MSLLLLANMIACAAAFMGFAYGGIKFFRPKKAIYAQMITLAAGCMAFGKLYQVVLLITTGKITDRFQLGVFGIVGSLLFLFSANFGVMNSLADDGSNRFRKYRIIAILAPVSALALYLVFFPFSEVALAMKVIAGIVTLIVMLASYFNLKHLIFPDVDYGVINCLKAYNLLAIFFELTCIAETVALSRGSDVAVLVTDVLMSVILIIIVPTVERGIKKWTT